MQIQTLGQLYEEARTRVQANPGDVRVRSALWQILAAQGEFHRARKQLDALVQLDSSWTLEVQACHGLLAAEETRKLVFDGKQAPVCIGTPPPWFGSLAAALPLLAAGETQAARPLLVQVREAAAARSGQLNTHPFEWICDGDARLGPCLEVVVQGRYFWLPWESVKSLEMRPPTEIRDRLWQHALLQVTDEGPIEVFINARYPAPGNDAEAMARLTTWEPIGDQLYVGSGQKTLMTNETEVGYLDIRKLVVK